MLTGKTKIKSTNVDYLLQQADSGGRCVSQQLQAAARYKFAPRFTEIVATSLLCMVRIPPYLFQRTKCSEMAV